MFKIALVGNPNSGKTTIFNKLTGMNQHIGNWPGVTVEKKQGMLEYRGVKAEITDLPGIYSLSPYSPEERITREFILKGKPDLILNIIDASNLERNLYLSLQLEETGLPVAYVLNFIDIIEKEGSKIDPHILESEFGHSFTATAANSGYGLDGLLALIRSSAASRHRHHARSGIFRKEIEDAVAEITAMLDFGAMTRFMAVKLLEHDREISAEFEIPEEAKRTASQLSAEIEQKYGEDIESLIITDRYNYVAQIISKAFIKNKPVKAGLTDRIDSVLLNRYAAFPLFLLSMFFIFSVTFGNTMSKAVDLLGSLISDRFAPFMASVLGSAGASVFTISLITDGIIEGVGSVIVFTPQLIVLFFFISFLEDSGYMARAALLTDRILRKMGLTGKSFIPFVVGFGCSVPAIMAARTLDSEKDRKLTIFLAPFMSCGARAPVYAMIASVYFARNKSLVIFTIYLAGILVAMAAGYILSRLIFKGEDAPFVLELPRYQLPRFASLLRHTFNRSKEFVKKAGTIILVASVAVWLLSNLDTSFRITTDYSSSLIAQIGKAVSYIFIPLGFGDWVPAVAIITGVFAKESVVSTIGILAGESGISSLFTPLSAYAFLIFILFYVPCVASIGAMRRELNSLKWTAGAVLFQTATAWIMAFIVYNAGKLAGLI